MKSIPADRLAWLWLLIGFLLLPFTLVQTVLPLAAWAAPILLLRFARTSRRAHVALPLLFGAYTVGGGAKIVGWQEGGATVLEEDKQQTLDRVATLARQYDAEIEVSLALLTRTHSQRFVRNQSILIDSSGAVLWTYDKTYPVSPAEAYFTIAGPGKLPVAETSIARLSTAICNDLHFLPLLRQAGQNGVDILIAPYSSTRPWESEDAVVASYRAIENGFSLVLPAGSGISTIADYEGRILGSQNFRTTTDGILLSSVPTRGVTTVYSRIGDLFAYLCAAGSVLLAGRAFIFRKQPVAEGSD